MTGKQGTSKPTGSARHLNAKKKAYNNRYQTKAYKELFAAIRKTRFPQAKKMMRCLCSVRCLKMFLTDAGHRIWPRHRGKGEGPDMYKCYSHTPNPRSEKI